jgi:uncharacterized protein YggE
VVLTAAARQSAFQDARHKAEQFAALAGQRLGRVQSISEQVQEPPPVPFYLPFGVATADRAISSVPIRGGSQQLTIRVSVVFSMS